MVETIGDFLDITKEEIINFIFENASNLIIIINEKFKIEYYNKKPHYQLLGYNPKEVIGKSPLDFIHPKERNYIIKSLNKVFEGIEEKIDIRLKNKEKNYKWFEINGRRIVDHLGITRVILISKEIFKYKKIKNLLRKRDIDKKPYSIYDSFTELSFWKLFQPKQFKVALEKSYEMLEFVINNIPQYIAWKDKNLVYLGCNFNFAQKIGVKNPINVIGKTDLDFFLVEKEIKASIEKERRILELGQPEFHVIESWSKTNGEKKIFDTNRIPLHDNEGNVVGILVTYEDITDRNKAEEALTESEKKYRDLAELLPDVIYNADTNLNITYVNPVALEKFKYTQKEFNNGVKISQVIADEEEMKARENLKKIFQGQITKSHEYLMKKKDGSTFYASIHSRPIYKDKKIIGLRGIIHDISERKLSEQKLKQSEKELRRLNKELKQKVIESTQELRESEKKLREQNIQLKKLDQIKNDFISLAAHELKTPLISISGYTDYILLKHDDNLKPEIKEDLLIIKRNINRLQGLMNKLLDVMKIDENNLELEKTSVKINDLIKNCIKELTYQINNKNHEIIINMDAEIRLNVDFTRIFHVFTNLLSNAIKFTPDKGRIEVSAMKEDHYFTFKIMDDGIGLTENEIGRLFKKFEMLNQSNDTKEKGTGTGLGLYISKGIVEAHGGKIWATSEGRDKGSSFFFTLPI